MEIKVGDYVRTKNYGICKIIDIYNEDKIELDKINAFGIKGVCYSIENIIKSSPNIIDLIEVGDYVNEYRVMSFEDNYEYYNDEIDDMEDIEGICIVLGNEEGMFRIPPQDIKSIVTKEQFSSMEYKIHE